jgi:hypothetical protein
VPELADHAVDLEGRQVSGNAIFGWGKAFIRFGIQERDPTADNDTDLTGAPVPGPAYRVAGDWVNVFGQATQFEGYMVDMPGGFSWLSLKVSPDDDSVKAGRVVDVSFQGYVSRDGLVAGRMLCTSYDSDGNREWAVTELSGQWPRGFQ